MQSSNDVCLNDNSDLADLNPVKAYWVLENGQKKSLNSMERNTPMGSIPREAGEEPISPFL